MPNLSKDFEHFHLQLLVPPDLEANIKNGESLIREHLRSGIEAFSKTEPGGSVPISPKFIPQGSWRYDTVVLPAQIPPQEVDYDLGVYLPVSYLGKEQTPSIANQHYFEKVDFLLKDLARKHGWTVDDSKQTCSRVKLNHKTHIDVPLYSIPDNDFGLLIKSAVNNGLLQESQRSRFDDRFLVDHYELWENLQTDRVLLARRNGTWEASDPRRVHNWFKGQVATHGDQLKRICRYVKAWRDILWSDGGPSSIFLMAVCCNAFKKFDGRDDNALLHILKKLPGVLAAPVVIDSGKPTPENLSSHQNELDIQLLRDNAVRFAASLEIAINSPAATDEVYQYVIQHLGSRFPLPEKPKPHIEKTKEEKIDLIQRHASQHSVGSPHFKG